MIKENISPLNSEKGEVLVNSKNIFVTEVVEVTVSFLDDSKSVNSLWGNLDNSLSALAL